MAAWALKSFHKFVAENVTEWGCILPDIPDFGLLKDASAAPPVLKLTHNLICTVGSHECTKTSHVLSG